MANPICALPVGLHLQDRRTSGASPVLEASFVVVTGWHPRNVGNDEDADELVVAGEDALLFAIHQ